MNSDVLDSLVAKLAGGDAEAIAEVFRAHEVYLRMLVRRRLSGRLRAKFDSLDIVQSVWARVLPGLREGRWRFVNARALRAFLVRVTRNHLTNRIQHAALDFNTSHAPAPPRCRLPSNAPKPDEGGSAEDLWQELLALCPPAHRQLLVLRREGVPLDQIAARTGLHKSSVRRILYDLIRRFRARRRAQAGPAEIS